MIQLRTTIILAVWTLLLSQAISAFADAKSETLESIRRAMRDKFVTSAVIVAEPGFQAIQDSDLEQFKLAVPDLDYVKKMETNSVSYIHIVAILGLEDFATYLIDLGVDIHGQSDKIKCTPFMSAMLTGQENMAKLFLNAGADSHETYHDTTALHLAARWGNIELLELLVANGVDVNVTTDQQVTPLMIAATMGNVDAAGWLIAHGADLRSGDRRARTPLHWAAKNNHVETMYELIDQGAKIDPVDTIGMTPLMLAAADGAREAVAALISHGAMVNKITPEGCSAISYAVTKGDIEIADILIEHQADLEIIDSHERTLLHLARFADDSYMIRRLLDVGLDTDARDKAGFTAIHRAVIENKTNTFQILLNAGADISIRDNNAFNTLMSCAEYNRHDMMQDLIRKGVDIDLRGKSGQTALMIASYYADTQTVATLLNAGADINARASADQHALNYAFWSTNLPTFTYLLEKGANPNLKSKHRWPLIFDVVSEEQIDFLRALISNKANINITDIEGHTALFTAARIGNEEIVQILIDAGVHVSTRGLSGLTAWHVANDSDHTNIAALLSTHMTDKQRNPTNRVTVYFDLNAPMATNVFVAGTFNGWRDDKHRLAKRDDDGWWYTELDVYPAYHGYKFVVDGAWIVDPLNPDIRIGKLFSSLNSIFHTKNKLVEKRPQRVPSKASDLLPVTFTYHSRTARTVSVVGEFNGWNTKTMPMRLVKVGVWSASTHLATGDYGYKFFVDGNWIMDPSNRTTIVVGKNKNSLIRVKALPAD